MYLELACKTGDPGGSNGDTVEEDITTLRLCTARRTANGWYWRRFYHGCRREPRSGSNVSGLRSARSIQML